MKLRRLTAIARKETLHLLRDWRSLIMALAIPLILVLLYGYALTLDLRLVPTVVWDQSRTATSRELLSLFDHSPYFRIVATVDGYEPLQQRIESGSALIGLVVPADFARRVTAGQPVDLQIIGDGSDANTSRLAMNYATTIVSIYARATLFRQLEREGRDQLHPPVQMIQRSWYNADLRSQDVLIPGIIALVMIVVAAMLTSTTIAREWENGTMEQLISTPLQAPELIFGKIVPYFVIGLVDVAMAVVIGRWVFGVPIVGNAGLLFALSALFLTGALFFGLTLSIVLKSQVLANQIAIVAGFLPTLLLSGFVFAIENMPEPLQVLTVIVPARYFISILRGIYLKGIGLEILWADALFLLLFAVLMMTLALRKFTFKLE
ncbi:ABC transporter permease [Desulfofustis glycolicus]|uniref:ABC-2 type transport system permease protein n=1 Tax=Desulfofustis glycolicus DSM 9705 TaxID=1121409 RepID=A0A1M5XUY1_9BACT|nr:ABC transporter permease [Desulfofustis glycolicus]MCB2217187.1 ABC transporter permease [Desulfobulbaceae bacterium]SHI03607.1 ABC-2 type transport system permease protein [Desulfofustis glycolicus DSM 9705]